MARQVLSKTTVVETFSPRATLDEPLDWQAVGLPVLGEAFAERQALWRVQFETARFVVPRFRRRAKRRKSQPELKLDHAPESTGTWCGGITIPQTGDRMDWVEGQWMAPYISLPDNPIGGQTYVLSSWVGMDEGASDILQAGVDATISLTNGVMQFKYQPWYQWYPEPWKTIDGVAVGPGDVVNCKIAMVEGSSTSAKVVFSNLNNGQNVTFGVTAPSAAAALAGRCAEWIVEAYGDLGPLAAFQSVEFDNCYSGTIGGQTLSAGQGATIQMAAGSGEILASAALNGSASVRIT